MNQNDQDRSPEETISLLTKILLATREKLYISINMNIELETKIKDLEELIQNLKEPKKDA